MKFLKIVGKFYNLLEISFEKNLYMSEFFVLNFRVKTKLNGGYIYLTNESLYTNLNLSLFPLFSLTPWSRRPLLAAEWSRTSIATWWTRWSFSSTIGDSKFENFELLGSNLGQGYRIGWNGCCFRDQRPRKPFWIFFFIFPPPPPKNILKNLCSRQKHRFLQFLTTDILGHHFWYCCTANFFEFFII